MIPLPAKVVTFVLHGQRAPSWWPVEAAGSVCGEWKLLTFEQRDVVRSGADLCLFFFSS